MDLPPIPLVSVMTVGGVGGNEGPTFCTEGDLERQDEPW